MANKRTTGPKPTAESVLDDAIGVLHTGIAAIRDEIQKIQSGKAAKSKFDKASRISYLAQKAGSIADSVRKAEAARSRRLDQLTYELVIAWFRRLEVNDRARFVRELQAIDSKRSGLA